MLRYRLLQARTADDPVRHEERASFCARLDVPLDAVQTWDLLEGKTDPDRVTDGVDAVLVGGSGAYSVLDEEPWLPAFFDTMGALADRGFPTFASCFGFQAMVVALGGTVIHDEPRAEVGTFEIECLDLARTDPLFAQLPDRFLAQLGHKDRASVYPTGLVNLASSARCEHQAFRVGDKPVWATQFHPELDQADNIGRMRRYLTMYQHVFGEEEAQRMLDAFLPSPEACSLLPAFQRYLQER